MSIKQKVVAGITFAVLASTVIVGAMAQRQARDVLSHRLIDRRSDRFGCWVCLVTKVDRESFVFHVSSLNS